MFILGALLLASVITALWKGGWQLTFSGFVKASELFGIVWVRLLLGFLLGGFIQAVIPSEIVSKWFGATSGLKGILIGSYGGLIMSGGPHVWVPVVASIYRAGADIGPVLALITARGIININMLFVWQIPFFGVELSLSRYIPCLFVPPIVGILGRALFRIIGWSTQSADTNAHSFQDLPKKGAAGIRTTSGKK